MEASQLSSCDLSGLLYVGPPRTPPRGQLRTINREEPDNFGFSSLLVAPSTAGFSSEGLQKTLADNNSEARPLWKPLHFQPVYSDWRFLANCQRERLIRTGVSLPSGSALTEQ